MSLRELTTVALRLLALWLIVAAVSVLPTVAYAIQMAVRPASFTGVQGFSILAPIFGVGARCVAGVLLFALSHRIAGLICSGASADPDSGKIATIRAGQLYHIAAFLMGICVVAQSFGPGARCLVAFASGIRPTSHIADLVHFLATLAFGMGLMMGSRGLAHFFSSLGHDPDDVPSQQFSVRAILIIVVCVAALLGLVRALVSG